MKALLLFTAERSFPTKRRSITRRTKIDKRAELLALAKLRQATRWPGYKCIGDYHAGAYECDFVSPYTKTAGNADAEIMVMLQDWASDEWASGPFDEASAKNGQFNPWNLRLSALSILARRERGARHIQEHLVRTTGTKAEWTVFRMIGVK